jgi:signal transduction histidine kinase
LTLQRYLDQASVLLELARVNSHGHSLKLQTIDLAALLTRVVEKVRPAALHYQIELHTALPAHCAIQTDAVSIEHVVENLLTNAFKHSGGSNVMVLLEKNGNTARVSVSDDGRGIGQAERHRIFGKFERGDATRSGGGSGLGLWIAKLLTDALGATISLHDHSSGGRVFIIEIPLRQPEIAD